MDRNKRKRLEAAGWKIGTVADFLGLSPEEQAVSEIRVALSRAVKKLRVRNKLSQVALAKKLGSSQSRVAKMEAGDPQVSLDLLLRGVIAAGASRREVAKVIAKGTQN